MHSSYKYWMPIWVRSTIYICAIIFTYETSLGIKGSHSYLSLMAWVLYSRALSTHTHTFVCLYPFLSSKVDCCNFFKVLYLCELVLIVLFLFSFSYMFFLCILLLKYAFYCHISIIRLHINYICDCLIMLSMK